MASGFDAASDDRQVRVVPLALLAALRGLGQIMFQNCPLTGLFFLVGIAIVSPLMAAGAAGAALVGTVTAIALRYDSRDICDGLYGFNASLVGIALLAFYTPTASTFGLGAFACVAATVLTHIMRQRLPVPAYTAPFVVTTWLAIHVAERLPIPAVVKLSSTSVSPGPVPITAAVVKGISEVMFQTSVLTGALFIVGIALCSWRGAVWALVGSLLGLLAGMEHHDSPANLSLGIYGYNAALAAMALALYRRSLLLPLVGAVVSVPLTEKFPLTGLATLTAPFVLATWMIIALDRIDASHDRTRSSVPG